MRPEYGLGSQSAKVGKDGLPQQVDIKGAASLSIAKSPHAAFYEEFMDCLPLARLQRIEQSSIGLRYIPEGKTPKEINPKNYETNRWGHTLEVAVLTEAILTQNGLPPEEVKLGIAAALLHDIATPGMGDVTMNADLDALDEEKNWDKVVDEKGRDFLQRHNLDPKVITQIIINGGKFGKVLDIADRISYVVSDAYEIARTEADHTTELLQHVATHPDIGSIYQDVTIDGDDVYFENPDRLAAFLKLRALLRRDFSENKYSIGRNQVAINAIRGLLDRGVVTPDELRIMEDGDLYRTLTTESIRWWRKNHGDGYAKAKDNLSNSGISIEDCYDPDSLRSIYQQFRRFNPDVEVFTSEEAMEKKKLELQKQRNTLILGVRKFGKFDTGVAYQVRGEDGSIVPFERYAPQQAGELEAIAEQMAGYHLIYKRTVSVSPRANG